MTEHVGVRVMIEAPQYDAIAAEVEPQLMDQFWAEVGTATLVRGPSVATKHMKHYLHPEHGRSAYECEPDEATHVWVEITGETK